MHYAYIINGNGRGGYIPLVIKIEKDETNANHEVIDGR